MVSNRWTREPPVTRGRGGFAMEMQVKRYLGNIRDPSLGTKWAVFETGSTRHYLFRRFDPTETFLDGFEVPVEKKRLAKGWKNHICV